MNDPKLLTRRLQKNGVFPDEDDYISEGKKVLPVDALSSAYRKFLVPDNSLLVYSLTDRIAPWVMTSSPDLINI